MMDQSPSLAKTSMRSLGVIAHTYVNMCVCIYIERDGGRDISNNSFLWYKCQSGCCRAYGDNTIMTCFLFISVYFIVMGFHTKVVECPWRSNPILDSILSKEHIE